MIRGSLFTAITVFLLLSLLMFPLSGQAEKLIIFKGKDINKLANLITIPNEPVVSSMDIQLSCWIPGLTDEDYFIYTTNDRKCNIFDFTSIMPLPDKSYFDAALSKNPLVIFDTTMGTIIGVEDWTAGIPDSCPKDPEKLEPGVCGCGLPDTDSDNDGAADCNDICINDPNKTTNAGQCGCGIAETDTDGDGIADCVDVCPNDVMKSTNTGQCGCGVAETDTDNDGVADCNDICINDPNKTTDAGQCGCGIAETDTDGDGIADCVENKYKFPWIMFLPAINNKAQN